jgi:hypothetical protein
MATALLASLPALAQYSWIDSKGHRVYSDLPPPPDIPQQNILSRHGTPVSAPAPVAPASAASGQDQALEEKKQAADAAEAARKKAEELKLAAQRADNCQRARTSLAGLQSGARVMQFNAQGERSYMTDEQRAAEVQRVQGVIESDCR